jgi:WD40 repeat protein
MARRGDDNEAGIREHVSASVRLSLATSGAAGRGRRDQVGQSQAFSCFERITAPVDALFAGCSDGSIVAWRIPATRTGTFREHVVLGTHKGNVSCMAFQAHHGVLVTGGADFCIKLWDAVAVDQGRCVQTIPAHDATVTALAAHCDVIISTSADKTVKLWKFDAERAKLCYPWMEVKQVFVLDTWATTLWASASKVTEASQGEIFVGDGNGNVTILRSELENTGTVDSMKVANLHLMRRIEGERKQGVVKVLPIPNLNLVVTLCYDDKARIRDVIGFHTLVTVDHPDGKRFIDVGWDAAHEELFLLDAAGAIHLWSTRSNKLLLRHQVGPKAVQLQFVKQMAWVAHRDAIDAVVIERTSTFAEYPGHTDRVLAVGRISVEAMELPVHWVTASADNSIAFWSRDVECLYQMRERKSEIRCFAVLASMPWCVSGHDDGSLKFWSLAKDTTFRFAAHDNTVSAVGEGLRRTVKGNQSEDWPHLFTASYDGCIALWEMPTEGSKAKCEARVKVSNSEVLCAVHDPLRLTYIVGTNDGDITVWSSDELKPVMRLRSQAGPHAPAHSGAVTCVALDGNIAFTGGEDEAILMWNMATGEHTRDLSLSPDGAEDLGEVQSFRVLPTSGNLLVATRHGHLVLFDQGSGAACWSHDLGREICSAHYDRTTQEVLAGMADGAIVRLVVGDIDVVGGPPRAAAVKPRPFPTTSADDSVALDGPRVTDESST